MRRIPRRRDGNEQAIVDTFKALGWSVMRVSAKGCCDLVCAKGNRAVFAEVKTATGKLTPAQVAFHRTWNGPPIAIVRRPEDVLALNEEQAKR